MYSCSGCYACCRCAALNCILPFGNSIILIAVYFSMMVFRSSMLLNCQNVLVLLITVYILINNMMLCFDTVDHAILLQRLQSEFGFTPTSKDEPSL